MITIYSVISPNNSNIKLTFDGQTGCEISDKDTIVIRKVLHPVYMITLSDYDYFDVLKTKLSWSGSSI
jgi:NAD+ kinase